MRYLLLLLALISILASGCAHSIDISPKTDKIVSASENRTKIKKTVGYIIPETLKNIEVNSRGGGGDSVNYSPYRDIAKSFEAMLLNVFEQVKQLDNLNDVSEAKKVGINYVITPEIVTDSYSTSSFTWPPTNFTVNLTSKITDTSDKQIKNIKVMGEGQAEFSEFSGFSGERGLSGIRAMEDALIKMQRSLFEMNYENFALNTSSELPKSKDSVSEKLEKLKGLNDRGLITPEEFLKKKKEIIDSI